MAATETPEEKKKREEAARNAPKPEPIKTSDQVQANLGAGQYAGEQTRRADNSRVSLMDQKAPAGKELIGMKSGVPIYADANDVYGGAAPASPAPQPAAAPAGDGIARTRAERLRAIGGAPAGLVPQPAAAPAAATPTAAAAPSQSLQQMRDTYQNSQTATATRAQQAPRTNPYEPVNRGGFFSKEYAQQFIDAQAAANQRAIDRIGAPRRDLPTSTTTTSTAAASALRNAAAQPRVATAEQVRAAGFGPKETDRLLFTENLTPEDLELYGRTAANKRLRDRSVGKY
jgi:hypothetical protein